MKALPLIGYLLLLIVFFFPVTFGSGSLSPAPYLPGTLPSGPAGSYAPAVRQAMLGRQPFIDPAPAWTSEPWAFPIGAMYRAGEAPLWNPHQGLGMPLAANMQSQALFPPRVPLFLAPSVEPWNAYHLLRPIVGGFFTYRFLRLVAVSRASAFAGGIAFMLTGHVVLYLTMWHLDAELLVPALMWLTEKLFRARTLRAAVALGLALALAALAGAPESLVLIALFVTAFYAFRTVAVGVRARRVVPALLEYGRYFAGAGALSIVVASPLLVLFLEYMWQGHAPAHTPRDDIGVWGVPLTGAVSLIVPYFFDHLRFQPMLPAPVGVYGLSNYLGVLPVALALLAPRRRLTWFFAAYSVVALLKTYGVNPVNLLGHLPLLERIIFYKYSQPVIAFGVVVLMALTADTLAARAQRALPLAGGPHGRGARRGHRAVARVSPRLDRADEPHDLGAGERRRPLPAHRAGARVDRLADGARGGGPAGGGGRDRGRRDVPVPAEGAAPAHGAVRAAALRGVPARRPGRVPRVRPGGRALSQHRRGVRAQRHPRARRDVPERLSAARPRVPAARGARRVRGTVRSRRPAPPGAPRPHERQVRPVDDAARGAGLDARLAARLRR